MKLRFPAEDTGDKKNLFMMTPCTFQISSNRHLKQKAIESNEPLNTVILPTPNSGLTLTETGTWDEVAGFQDAEGAVKNMAGEKAKEGLGALWKHGLGKGGFMNDYASLAYQGSNFREFSFSWVLVPSSEEEAKRIQAIIEFVRNKALPDYSSTSGIHGLTKFPYMWKVNPAVGSPIKLQLMDSVITNVTVNYTPSGVLKTYSSGHPLSTNLEISFKELYRATRS